ncbi:PrsW family intramembrane metalloprotease [Candidatus Peregrinibacteria bacterium]|jgi:RsiW-degrading membrane proteinase PrsW (M82 family)|nr:PrsW family intramembrane metalloprotease [Candidatus Peregrinibacteria bacterium]MBT4148613.1 PrsW family intramembrane metalloprotease [Candidatus Peregrinibacteria bacterium]MBT4455770.1 PrsW family intramembrane metalloprotease [Candidatus Peregrinibacteria bacterium]
MENPIQLVGSITLALIPAIIWGVLFYLKRPENRKLSTWTFLAGAISVFPILLYKLSWQYFPQLNAFRLAENYKYDFIGFTTFTVLPLSVIITFMLVGVIEEIMKYVAVKVGNSDNLLTVDDAIMFFIIAALGFSFTENILYFYNIWVEEGLDKLMIPFMFRSLFSTFAHIMFSGIMGYYYGVAHFAKPFLQKEIRAHRKHWTILFHKILSIKKERLFHQEKFAEGLLIAVGLHAIFNIFLEMNLTFLTVPFLVGGYISLTYLFAKKENHKRYGHLFIGERNHEVNPHKNYFKSLLRFFGR